MKVWCSCYILFQNKWKQFVCKSILKRSLFQTICIMTRSVDLHHQEYAVIRFNLLTAADFQDTQSFVFCIAVLIWQADKYDFISLESKCQQTISKQWLEKWHNAYQVSVVHKSASPSCNFYHGNTISVKPVFLSQPLFPHTQFDSIKVTTSKQTKWWLSLYPLMRQTSESQHEMFQKSLYE